MKYREGTFPGMLASYFVPFDPAMSFFCLVDIQIFSLIGQVGTRRISVLKKGTYFSEVVEICCVIVLFLGRK